MKHEYMVIPERKHQSSVRMFEGDSKATKLRQAKSVDKKMIRFFFQDGYCLTMSLEEQKTVNTEWYTTICLSSVLQKVREKKTKKSHPIAPRQCFAAPR
ncbi:hypothetical protein EVAR_59387_1 [Eumeta japonica]|uniref:Uncharacterized protein n=1 Tax=Eumeta variegata TaxID=151549 RepID=A0A4C1YL82_EUMVA|nr:hypothetical protein EVAR_59387_1 [Eumeta japonica]